MRSMGAVIVLATAPDTPPSAKSMANLLRLSDDMVGDVQRKTNHRAKFEGHLSLSQNGLS